MWLKEWRNLINTTPYDQSCSIRYQIYNRIGASTPAARANRNNLESSQSPNVLKTIFAEDMYTTNGSNDERTKGRASMQAGVGLAVNPIGGSDATRRYGTKADHSKASGRRSSDSPDSIKVCATFWASTGDVASRNEIKARLNFMSYNNSGTKKASTSSIIDVRSLKPIERVKNNFKYEACTPALSDYKNVGGPGSSANSQLKGFYSISMTHPNHPSAGRNATKDKTRYAPLLLQTYRIEK